MQRIERIRDIMTMRYISLLFTYLLTYIPPTVTAVPVGAIVILFTAFVDCICPAVEKLLNYV